MKKTFCLLFTILIVVFVLFLVNSLFYSDTVVNETDKHLDNSFNYLTDKYGEDLKIELLNYSIKDSFRANYCLKNSPEVKFSVCYWKNKETYWDDLLQQMLSNELKNNIIDIISQFEMSVSNITIGSIVGPTFELSERLHQYLKQKDRELTISDIRNKETFSYVSLEFENELPGEMKEAILNAFLQEELPVKRYIVNDVECDVSE